MYLVKKTFRKAGLLFIAFSLIVSMFYSPGASAAASDAGVDSGTQEKAAGSALSDIKGHWAEKQITEWFDEGLVKGYADGAFKPNAAISRGETMALVNRSFGFSAFEPVSFSDLKASEWVYEDVAKAVKAGYIAGLGDGTIGAGKSVSRQETAVMIARLLQLESADGSAADGFKDAADIAAWSKQAVGAVAAAGIMQGSGGRFKPKASLTRAIKSRASSAYNKAGTYGPEQGVQEISGDVVISVPGVTLQNVKIGGDLLLAEGIGEGDVYLRNVTVLGTTTVQGGGENSIHLVDSVLVKVIVDKKAGIVRIVIEGTTTIAELVVSTTAIIETDDEASIALMLLDAVAKVLGKGVIKKAIVSEKARGTTFELKPIVMEGAGAQNPGSNGGSPGGEGGTTQIRLSALSAVNGTLTATFNQSPSAAPVVGDFTVHVIVNGGAAEPVVPTLVAWNQEAKQATITVPAIAAAGAEQSIVYTAAYKGTPAVQSAPIVLRAGVEVVANGQPNAVVVVPVNAEAQVDDAADLLIAYVKKATGAQLTKLTAAEWEENGAPAGLDTVIYIGTVREADAARIDGLLANLDDDGFVIDSQTDTLLIMGPTEYGTQYGVYEFLERFVGVRWLMPGEIGEDVPQSDELYVPLGTVNDEPSTISRQMFGLHTPDFKFMESDNTVNYEWGIRNRLHDRISGYQHNMSYLFLPIEGYPAENYPTEHPEVYPMRNGERFIPTTEILWQPCFSEPITAELAIGTVIEYFNNHPDATSFSLAVNDGLGYCEAEPDHPKNPHKTNSMGYPDMSDIYFKWVNDVAEGVLKVHPDKWFGVLAYLEVNDPPSFKLHPRVIPYFTKDRMAWIDDGIRIKDQTAIEKWNKVSDNLAFYDYVYGTPYMVPRVYPHQMAEYLRYGKEHGVIAYFSELLQNWGEGPKPWLMTKLLWNPDQDVDALLNDWYVRAVGAEAASDLKAYYDHWEHFWTERIKDTDWFEERKDITYLSYYWGTYLEAVTDEEIAASRQLLESVVAKAVTSAQKARAELLLKQFEYYEASAISYPKKVNPPANEQAALKLLEEGARSQIKADYAQKRLELIEQFKNDPLLEHSMDPVRDGLVWSGWSPSLVWAVADYVTQNESAAGPVRSRIAELAAGDDEGARKFAQLLLHVIAGSTINANPSFETGADAAQSWDSWIFNYGEFKRIEQPEHARSGNASIYVHNFYYGDLSQTVPVKSGLITARMSYYVTKETKTVGDTWLQLDLLDENGATLTTFRSNQQAYSANRGKWNDISVMGDVPEKVNGTAVKSVKISVTVNGFFEGGELYMDDFEVFQSEESDPLPPLLISQVQASGEQVAVTLYEDPEQTPVAEDFTVTRIVNGKSGPISPTAVDWIANERKAILSVPALAGQIWEQSVVYSVTYRNSAAVKSAPYEVQGNVSGLEQIVPNASFENGSSAGTADNWTFWGDGFARSSAVSRTGSYSIAADGLQPGQNEAGGGGPFQTVTLEPGHYVGVFRFNTTANTNGSLSWSVQPKDGSGTITRTIPSDKRPASVSKGAWVPFEFEFDIAAGESAARFFVLMNDFKKGDTIYFDDVEIYKIPGPEASVSAVNAIDGQLEVVFGTAPGTEPAIADFTLSRSINASNETSVAPTAVTWDAGTKTATITVPAIEDQLWDQSVVYHVSYGAQDAVKSAPVVKSGTAAGLTSIALNGSFENWNSDFEAQSWAFWGEGFTRSNAVVRSGTYSMAADGLQPGQNAAGGGGPLQTVPVEAGSYFGIFRFNTNVPTNGKLSFVVHQLDAGGNVTSNVSSGLRSAARSSGNWTPFEFSFDVAPGTVSLRYFIVMNDFEKGDTIYFDDVEIFKKQ